MFSGLFFLVFFSFFCKGGVGIGVVAGLQVGVGSRLGVGAGAEVELGLGLWLVLVLWSGFAFQKNFPIGAPTQILKSVGD